MKKLLLITLTLLAGWLQMSANYTLNSFSGNVTVRQNGRTGDAQKGMTLTSADEITIAKGGTVEIYNASTKELFTSSTPGTNTVMGIMLDSRKKASNTVGSMNERWTVGKNKSEGNTRLYTEGLVKRTMTVYDPEARNFEVDPHQLAIHVYSALTSDRQPGKRIFPTEVASSRLEDNGLGFSVTNTLKHPIYMNLIKINETAPDAVELSELGQPMWCYVILPGQTISRSQLEGLDKANSHLLIMTYCRFDIDNLIEQTNEFLKSPPTESSDSTLPVFIGRL